MSGFDLLHPALQHHIVNSLGWRELRPFQDEVIPPLLEGKHLIVIAPTAGGKTEAAFFPVASRMLEEGWTGLSVLYVCPIKALLNNLHVRLDGYCRLIGRKCSLWHGDIGTSERRKILREPPDILLTTPESLEVMLISQKIDRKLLFANLQAIVIDEIHAFAGDDRGWHLLSVLERVSKLAGREVQRIGLSATIGKAWKVNHIDWKKKVAYVEPTQASGRSQWFSLAYTGLGYALSQSIQMILAHDDTRDCWSKRACERLRDIRMEHPWVQVKSTALVQGPSGGLEWWNFAGFKANASFTRFFRSQFEGIIRHDGFKISIDPPIVFPELHEAITDMLQIPIDHLVPEIDPRSVEGLKFSVCLPEEFAIRMLERRLYDAKAIELVLRNDITDIVLPPELRQGGGVEGTECVEEFEQQE